MTCMDELANARVGDTKSPDGEARPESQPLESSPKSNSTDTSLTFPSSASSSIGYWNFLSYLKRFSTAMSESVEENDLEDIHSFIYSIDKYEISKNFLFIIPIGMLVALMFSNSPVAKTAGMRVAAAILPISFTSLFIGILLRKEFIKFSFLFQFTGIGLAIFALSASCFSYLTKELKWIPVVTATVCIGAFVKRISNLIKYKKGVRIGD